MSSIKKCLLLTSLLFAVSAYSDQQSANGDNTITLTGDLFARSSPNFTGDSNILSVVPSGSQAQVLETKKLGSGSYAVHVKIIDVNGTRGTTAKAGQDVWLYDSKTKPWIQFAAGENPVNFSGQLAAASEAVPPARTCPVTSPARRNIDDLNQLRRAADRPESFKEYFGRNTSAAESDEDDALPTQSSSGDSTDPLVKYRNNRALQAKVNKMISYAERRADNSVKMKCYHFVKEALLLGADSGSNPDSILRHRPDGPYAREGVSELKAEGMVNLLDYPKYKDMAKDPEKIPKGAVVVYSYGNTPGHIEIKTSDGNGNYCSDFTESDALSSKAPWYHIIGVMIPQ